MVISGTAMAHVDKYLSFQIGDDVYAVNIIRVKEIIEYGEIELTSMPMMPNIIKGALNLRGKAVPVIDLSVRLGHHETALSRRTCIIVVEHRINDESMDIGVIVDCVNQVLEISDDNVEPPPTFGGRINVNYIDGMGKINNHFVILLKLDAVLSMDDVELLEAVESVESEPISEMSEDHNDYGKRQVDMLGFSD